MLKITNQALKQKYCKKMCSLKKANRDYFFSKSIKRKILYPIFQCRFSRQLLESICPYSYNDIKYQTNFFSNEKIAIYTGVFGGYDMLYDPKIVPDNCEFFVFSDNEVKSDIWKKREYIFPNGFGQLTNANKNRFLKMHPHLLFPDFKYSIYIDGNIEIITDFTEYIDSINSFGLKLHNHYNRNCAYDEIDECIRQKKCSIAKLEQYRKRLLNEKFPHKYGLLEAPVIVREHNNKKCIELMNQWWSEYYSFVERDQLALMYVLWKNRIKPSEINQLGRDIHSNYSFIQHTHVK